MTQRIDPAERLVSLDAYRGFTMLAMASGGLALPHLAESHASSRLWQAAAYQLEHVAWTGCSAWDLIQPSFFFIVGVAIPFSQKRRSRHGDSYARSLAHAVIRSLVLVALGVFLYSNGRGRTNFVFTNVLAQIGLGYTFVFLVLGRGVLVQLGVILAILLATWGAFFLYPIGNDEFARQIPVPADWHRFDGLAGHWNKYLNAAGAFDRWFLNLFPREGPYRFDSGGYQTLNFVPSIVNMLLGLMAGERLAARGKSLVTAFYFTVAGLVLLAIPLAVDHTLWPTQWPPTEERWRVATAGIDLPFSSHDWTICPAVKRVWTPTFALFSAGWTFLFFAAFYFVIDILGWRAWAFPLVVVGMNSIAIYLMSQLMEGWVAQSLRTHFGAEIFRGELGPF